MASLKERLDRIREGFAAQAPDDVKAIMGRAAAELKASGLADSAVGEGDEAPNFALENQDGDTVVLEDLLAHGPVVLSVFRGHW